MKKWMIVLIVVIVLCGAGYFIYQKYLATNQEISKPKESEKLEIDSKKEETHLSKVRSTKGAYWQRMFELWWEEVESEEGNFDWSGVDQRIKEANKMEVIPVVTIKPFANWDQDTCHEDSVYEADSHVPDKNNQKTDQKVKVGAPCDINAYADFLEKAVERYDGDGKDDMSGLKIPVKYWEIMNEPSMQGEGEGGMGEELKFFYGTSDEYLEILKTSYETIKKADPEAKVLHAGMAGMQQNFVEFWEPIMEAGAGDYFDIANIHTINTDERREDLYVIKFKEFLKKYGYEDKPIWVTEVQYGELVGEPEDLEAFEKLIAKSTVFALAQGADKLFYIENWLFWGDENTESSIAYKENSTHKVYLNLVNKINFFDKIEILKEEYVEHRHDNEGATSTVGHYKFTSEDDIIYILWGGSELPGELQIDGFLKVTDIYGETEEVTATDSILSDSPIFVVKS